MFDTLFTITNYYIWQTIILIYFEDLAFLNKQYITSSLQIYFSIAKYSLKIEYTNISCNLNNSINNLAIILKSDISNISLTNIYASKQLCSTIVEEDQVSNFLINKIQKSLISTILISQQFCIILYSTNTTSIFNFSTDKI